MRWAEGKRVLVAEDEFLVAMLLEEELSALGCAVVGPFTTLAAAIDAARREAFDLAILDVNLNGEMAYPLADELLERGIPFVFLSGYVTANMPERFRASPRLPKPYEPTALAREIKRLVGKV